MLKKFKIFFASAFGKKSCTPHLLHIRNERQQAAVVFVHGFSGNAATWAQFLELLKLEATARSWDIYSICFPTSALRLDIPNLWSADPEISTLATSLTTTMCMSPLSGYKRIFLVAHSMGGLVVQRAVVDSVQLRSKLSHLVCFGTPSGGLDKARLGSLLKRQLRDMGSSSSFIVRLRHDWDALFPTTPKSFDFLALQGDKDEFVSGSSSLTPFHESCQRVISGTHLEIVRPENREHKGYQLVLQLLQGNKPGRAVVDGAALAVELGQFQVAVETLLPRAGQLDRAAKITLALALDGLGRSREALEMLEEHGEKDCPEAQGVLAGRIKRRWLVERKLEDLQRSRSLYMRGLELAEMSADHAQAHYHAINIAFLDLMSAAATDKRPLAVAEMAQCALNHAAKCSEDVWSLATQGEAMLMLLDFEKGIEFYQKAVAANYSPRAHDSMYSQAFRVAERVGDQELCRKIEEVFGVVAN